MRLTWSPAAPFHALRLNAMRGGSVGAASQWRSLVALGTARSCETPRRPVAYFLAQCVANCERHAM